MAIYPQPQGNILPKMAPSSKLSPIALPHEVTEPIFDYEIVLSMMNFLSPDTKKSKWKWKCPLYSKVKEAKKQKNSHCVIEKSARSQRFHTIHYVTAQKITFFYGMVVWFYDLFCAKTVAWELACAVLRAKKLEKLILDGAVREKWNVRFKGSMREKKCLVVWMCPSRASSKAFWACSPQFYYRLMTLKGCWRHGKTKNAWLH